MPLFRLLVGFVVITSVLGFVLPALTAPAAATAPAEEIQTQHGRLNADLFSDGIQPIDRSLAHTSPAPAGDSTVWHSVTGSTALTEGPTILDVITTLPLVAGYSRFDDSDPLAHDLRRSLYQTIVADPGIHVAGLARTSDAHVSTVRYHIRMLVREGLIERTAERGRSRLYPTQMDEQSHVRLTDGTQREILVALDHHGEATGSELATTVDRTRSTVSYHLKRLAEDGLVDRHEDGRAITNTLTDTGQRALGSTVETATADD